MFGCNQKNHRIAIWLFTVLLLVCNNGRSQKYNYVNSFTTENGLPSNHIYDITEDNQGFLWIATNNGVSRFDGKFFQNFSVNDGLPSNDAVQVVKDGSGTIWVNCYKEHVSYFDNLTNRFILLKENEDVEKIAKTFCFFGIDKEGNLVIESNNGIGSFSLKRLGKKGESFISLSPKELISIGNRKYLINRKRVDNKTYRINICDGEQVIDSFNIPSTTETFFSFFNKKIYELNNYSVKKITVNNVLPIKYTVDPISFNFPISRFVHVGNQKFVVISSKMLYLLDENKFTIQDSIENLNGANTAFIDKNNSLWICSLDKGLVHYSSGVVQQIAIPPNLIKTNFLSIAASPKGEIFAGNYYGSLLQVVNNCFISHSVSVYPKGFWLRKTLYVNSKVITLNDYCCEINFKHKIIIKYKYNGLRYPLKSAAILNDSIVIIGSNKGLVKLNINTRKYLFVNSIQDRTLNLVKGTGNLVYYIGTNGLYEYDFDNDSETLTPLNNYLENSKLSTLAFAPDSTLWAATTNGNIFVLKNNLPIAELGNSAGLPQNIVCMNVFKNKVWVGSKTGISVIRYSWKNKLLDYSISNISKTDGLPSNAINDFTFYNDTVYAATENGIAKIPFYFASFQADIVPRLTEVRVNQKPLSIANHFSLAADQNNIALTFAGVDLTGHFLRLQYTTDNDTLWNDLQGNTLNTQLYSGTHRIRIRAVDVNNRISKTVLQLSFVIATPFYQQWWFITLVALFFPSLLLWYLFSRRQQILKADFETQLALERAGNRITADLHDDIGTTLSSINIYSNIAGQLIDKDTAKAKEILGKLSLQTKSMLENLGEIIWSLKTGKEQFVNIESRIKNYVSDVVGATSIDYQINIADSINNLKDVRLRKNALLIVKEAVNNAIKYSKATTISINMHIENNEVRLEINDNGIGLNESKSTMGNGLHNMNKRAEELKGTIEIDSETGRGTRILARLPLTDWE